jgi:hypothetical protein
MVTRLDQKGWVFTYIGANQDAMIEDYKLGIKNSLNSRLMLREQRRCGRKRTLPGWCFLKKQAETIYPIIL